MINLGLHSMFHDISVYINDHKVEGGLTSTLIRLTCPLSLNKVMHLKSVNYDLQDFTSILPGSMMFPVKMQDM